MASTSPTLMSTPVTSTENVLTATLTVVPATSKPTAAVEVLISSVAVPATVRPSRPTSWRVPVAYIAYWPLAAPSWKSMLAPLTRMPTALGLGAPPIS